jgi:hypothetical protein
VAGDRDNEMTLVFRCPAELQAILPPPVPAVVGLPDWFKAMPQKAFNLVVQAETDTVKRCPPFIDAMTYGFMIPLACDLKVKDGEFSWDLDLPFNSINNFMRSPISFHDASQVTGTPFHQDDRFVIKFNNFWTVEAPPGYSLLFTHPVNRPDLPFTTLTGLVDCDRYVDTIVHFPAQWHDLNFSGVLPKGTPVAQCIPVKRESWAAKIDTLSADGAQRMRNLTSAMDVESGVYRRKFRAGKR